MVQFTTDVYTESLKDAMKELRRTHYIMDEVKSKFSDYVTWSVPSSHAQQFDVDADSFTRTTK